MKNKKKTLAAELTGGEMKLVHHCVAIPLTNSRSLKAGWKVPASHSHCEHTERCTGSARL